MIKNIYKDDLIVLQFLRIPNRKHIKIFFFQSIYSFSSAHTFPKFRTANSDHKEVCFSQEGTVKPIKNFIPEKPKRF